MGMTIERDVAIQRAMWEQGVASSLHLVGPLGDALREEVRPVLEALVAKGLASPDVLRR